MKEKKGFGKADRFVERLAFEKRLVEAERKAAEVCDSRNLTSEDWAFLELDAALLVGCFVSEERGFTLLGARHKGELGEVRLRKGEHTYVLQVVHTLSEPPLAVAGVVGEGPDVTTLLERAESLLEGPGVAFSVVFDRGGRRTVLADYALDESHAWEKAVALSDGKVEGKVAVSKHPSLGSALAFSFSLNKSRGVLFGGHPYEGLSELLKEELK